MVMDTTTEHILPKMRVTDAAYTISYRLQDQLIIGILFSFQVCPLLSVLFLLLLFFTRNS